MKNLLRSILKVLSAIVIAGISIPAIAGGLVWSSDKIGLPIPLEVLGAMALVMGLVLTIRQYYDSLSTMKLSDLAGLVVNGLAALLLMAGMVWNVKHDLPGDRLNGFIVAALIYPAGLVLMMFAGVLQMAFNKKSKWANSPHSAPQSSH